MEKTALPSLGSWKVGWRGGNWLGRALAPWTEAQAPKWEGIGEEAEAQWVSSLSLK